MEEIRCIRCGKLLGKVPTNTEAEIEIRCPKCKEIHNYKIGKKKRMIARADLDRRICDVEGGENTQTYREFIRESEEAFGMANEPIDDYPDDEIDMYIMELDYLWKK